jgi:hypothetical protein
LPLEMLLEAGSQNGQDERVRTLPRMVLNFVSVSGVIIFLL